MANYLNIGIMQNSGSIYYEESVERIERELEGLMHAANTPDLVVGSEMGLGLMWNNGLGMDADIRDLYAPIPNKITDKMGELAKEYGIYFIPGSISEYVEVDGKGIAHNTMPIYGPDGKMIDTYRKMCPYYPTEEVVTKGERYVVFDIPEKNTRVGIMNCHDWCFPEISRNLTLMGAEVLLRPAVDPEGLYEMCKHIPPVRAFENQAYFLSVNMAGKFLGNHAYGHSMLAGPDGRIIYEAGENEVYVSVPVDLDVVKNARRYGTNNTEQLLRQLPYFNPPMPYANKLQDAPVFKDLPAPDLSVESREEDLICSGILRNRK